ncbi:uncharacterized protein LOC135109370 [Scylla paramamosain]|uniref:uncharacterized protein LOC135109370 n=1 Tax=Scylla paramamosain TaxID=85552 RepID=UPI003083BBAF
MMMIPTFILIGASETNLGLYSGLTLYAIEEAGWLADAAAAAVVDLIAHLCSFVLATATLRSGRQVGGSDGSGGGSGGEVDGRDGGAVQAADIKEKKNVRRSKVAFGSLILDLVGLTVVMPLSPALFDCYSKHDSSGLYSSVLSCVTYYQHIIGVPARFHSVLFWWSGGTRG